MKTDLNITKQNIVSTNRAGGRAGWSLPKVPMNSKGRKRRIFSEIMLLYGQNRSIEKISVMKISYLLPNLTG